MSLNNKMDTVMTCLIQHLLHENKKWLKLIHINSVTKKQLNKLAETHIVLLRINDSCKKCLLKGFKYCTNHFDFFYGKCNSGKCIGCLPREKGSHIASTCGIIVYWHYYNSQSLNKKLWPVIVPAFASKLFIDNELADVFQKRKELLTLCTLLSCIYGKQQTLPQFIHLFYMLGFYFYDNETDEEFIHTKVVWGKGYKMHYCDCIRIQKYKIASSYFYWQHDLYKDKYKHIIEKKLKNDYIQHYFEQLFKKANNGILVHLYRTTVYPHYDYLFIRKCKTCLQDEQKFFEIRSLLNTIKRIDGPKKDSLLKLLKDSSSYYEASYSEMVEHILNVNNDFGEIVENSAGVGADF